MVSGAPAKAFPSASVKGKDAQRLRASATAVRYDVRSASEGCPRLKCDPRLFEQLAVALNFVLFAHGEPTCGAGLWFRALSSV
jgi:hypothetical protein